MKRVVITGLGIVSSIGNNKTEVTESLKTGKSGIEYCKEYAELGFRSHVHGPIRLNTDELIDRKLKRFMGDAAAFAFLAMQEAIEDSGLTEDQISSPRVGVISGSGGGSNKNMVASVDLMRARGANKVGPMMVPRIMASTTSACLAVAYKIKGVNYSISSACATSTHCIGNAYEIIQAGKQDIIFAGGADEVHWSNTLLFDRMGALSSSYNDAPEVASRPYDTNRDGFVISGGGGVLVLEELEHALQRNAHIHAEITGYAATSDGIDMVKPSGEGAARCMQEAIVTVNAPIDYINTHATGTLAGDIAELMAIKKVFGEDAPRLSSTKSLTGHGLGAAGANETIYSILMMENDFISASANVRNIDEYASNMRIITKREDHASLNTVMSNSFGFGGTNATLVLQRLD